MKAALLAALCLTSAAHAQCEPELISSLSGSARDVEVIGDFAFVANVSGGLHVIDISDPTDPILKSAFVTSNAQDLEVVADTIYLADTVDGVIVIDITDPLNPALIATFEVIAKANAIAVNNDLAFVMTNTGLDIIDVADPAAPILLSTTDIDGYTQSVAAGPGVVFVAVGELGVLAFDVSDPAAPSLISTTPLPDDPLNLRLVGDTLYVAASTANAMIFDVSDPAAPALTQWIDIFGVTRDIRVVDDLAYILQSQGGVWIYDVNDAAEPIGFVSLPGYAASIAVQDDLAFVAGAGLRVLDIANRTDPAMIGEILAPGSLLDIVVRDDIAFLAHNGSNDFMTLDVADPAQPRYLDRLEFVGDVGYIHVDGDIAYLSGASYQTSLLHVVDVSDPNDLVLITTLIVPYAGPIDKVGDAIVIASFVGDMSIVDVSDPSHPQLAYAFDLPDSANDIAIVDEYVLIADMHAGLVVVDISGPPQLVAIADTPGEFWGVDVVGDLAFVTEAPSSYFGDWDANTLFVFDISDPTNPLQIAAFTIPLAGQGADWPRTIYTLEVPSLSSS